MKQATLLMAVTIAFCGNLASAASYNLQSLITNDTVLTIGDKKFYDFGFGGPTGTCVTDPLCIYGPTGASDIIVTELFGAAPGVRFSGPMFVDAAFSAGPRTLDFQLFYSVMSLAGSTISGIQALAGAAGSNGTMAITETVFDNSSNQVAQSTLTFADLNDPPGELFQLDDLVITPPLNTVHVRKDVRLAALAGGHADATIIEQRFEQVPEPTTLSLVGAGVIGLIVAVRRRKTATQN